jgi:CxxC-x17-CxxC domain-containing protein
MSFNRDNRDNRRPASMHQVTCSECGKRCEVPFKPTGQKPVYCSNCFEKHRDDDSGRGNRFPRRTESSGNKEQLDKIILKLDEIINLMVTQKEEAVKPKRKAPSLKEVVKKVTKKKK